MSDGRGVRAAPVLSVHRCSISAPPPAESDRRGSGGGGTRAAPNAERERLSFGDIVGRVLEVSWRHEAGKTEDAERNKLK